MLKKSGTFLEVVNKEKKYFDEYESEFYEVTLKNVSKEELRRISFSFNDGGIQEIYNMQPNDEYKVIAPTTDENLDFSIISVEFDIPNYFYDEVEIEANIENDKISGTVKNNLERILYPNQIIMFFKDNNDGSIYQKTLEYSGCFDEERVIMTGGKFKFELKIPENTTFIAKKGITLKYSDIDFKDYQVYTQYDIKM